MILYIIVQDFVVSNDTAVAYGMLCEPKISSAAHRSISKIKPCIADEIPYSPEAETRHINAPGKWQATPALPSTKMRSVSAARKQCCGSGLLMGQSTP
jgi:hypothetical protein